MQADQLSVLGLGGLDGKGRVRVNARWERATLAAGAGNDEASSQGVDLGVCDASENASASTPKGSQKEDEQ